MKSSFCVFLIVCLVLGVSAAVPQADAGGVPATDGAGLMSVSPTGITYGSGAATLTFTFTADADFVSGSQVEIDVPAGWTAPTTAAGAGHVSWNAGTCVLSGAPPVGIAGSQIFIDIASCPTGSSFTVTYANATPGPVGPVYEFTTWTDIGAGGQGLVQILSTQPTVTVDPKVLTVSSAGLTPSDKVYDAAVAATLTIGSPALVGVVGADSVSLVTGGATAGFTDANVGTGKTVFISGLTLSGAQAGNYSLTQPTRTASITRRPLTVTAVTDTKTYDGNTNSSGVPTITSGALQGSDTATWTQTFSNRNAGLGNKVLTPAGIASDGNGGGNYGYTYAAFNAGTINRFPITVTGVTDAKVYDGTTASGGTPKISTTLAPGDTPAFTQAFDTRDVGINKNLTPAGVVADGNGGNNYACTFLPDTTGVITAKRLTVSPTGLSPNDKVYDGLTDATLTVGSPSLVGVISPDAVTLVTTGATGNFADRHVGTGKTVGISGLALGGVQAGNYSLAQPSRTADITARPITVTAATDTREYDGGVSSNGVPTITAGSLAPGDSAPAWAQTFNSKHAGTNKTVSASPSPVSDGNGGSNYLVGYATAAGTIARKPITVVGVTDAKAYDGTTLSTGVPTLFQATPLAAGDSEPVWSQTFANKNVGTGKSIIPAGAVNDGNGGDNYTYTFVPDTTGAITARAITVTARSDSKTYDGTTASSLAPSFAPDLVGSETAGFTQAFDTPDAGTGKTLTPSGLVDDGNGGDNYSYTYVPSIVGVIGKATPTLSVTNSPVTYTGSPQAAAVGSGSVAGAVSNVQYDASATAPTNAGTYAVTADFTPTDATNYESLAGASAGSFTIGKATPTASVRVTNSPVTYSGAPKAAAVAIVTSSVPGSVRNIRTGGAATQVKAGRYAVVADFIPTDTANYLTLAALPAGYFVIRGERLVNGGFNTYLTGKKIPKYWVAASFATADGRDTLVKKEGAASVKVVGALGKTKTLTQTLVLGGAARDAFTLSFWAKASLLPLKGLCQAQVLVYNGTVLKGAATLKCPAGTTYSWRQAKLNFTAPTAYTRVLIRLTSSKPGGTVWFDGVSLLR